MSEKIVSQDEVEVKCTIEWCEEPVFREGLCWEHFLKEKLDEWDAQDAEATTREANRESLNYVFGDGCEPALDGGWHGYSVEEVCR
jgi:hypothetical protein